MTATENVNEDLAAAYRILADHCVIDAYGHVSIRSAQNPNRYLMARSLAPELVTEDDILAFDLDSNLVGQSGIAIYKERFIHGEIYKARPDVNAVVHNHSPSVIPFGVTPDQPLRGLFNTGAFVSQGIPIFEIRDFQGSGDLMVRNAELGQALARVVGDKPAALMRGHGAVVVAPSLPVVVARSVYLEMSAKLQAQAMTIAGPGGRITYLDEIEAAIMVARQDYERAWHLWRSKAVARLRAEKTKKNVSPSA
jgi:HCOMODA/2-hydroxy-3-carboxy-muconic semialdehyde decarboxylase